MQQQDPVGVAAHPFQRVLPAPVHPVGVHLHEDQFGVGVVQHRLVHLVAAQVLKLLVMVVVVEPHLPVRAQPSDLVEEVRAAQHVVAVSRPVELDVATDLCVTDLGLVVQDRRQPLELQRIDVASHHLQAEVGKCRPQFAGRQPEPDAVVGTSGMVGRLEIAVAEISDAPEGRHTRLGESIPHRIELQSDTYGHVVPFPML